MWITKIRYIQPWIFYCNDLEALRFFIHISLDISNIIFVFNLAFFILFGIYFIDLIFYEEAFQYLYNQSDKWIKENQVLQLKSMGKMYICMSLITYFINELFFYSYNIYFSHLPYCYIVSFDAFIFFDVKSIYCLVYICIIYKHTVSSCIINRTLSSIVS